MKTRSLSAARLDAKANTKPTSDGIGSTSANPPFTTPTGTVVHACMLYKVNLEALEQAITPTAAKLAKHAVASVRQRVRNLGDIRDLGPIQTFRQLLENQLIQ